MLVLRKLINAIKIDPVDPTHDWARELRLLEHLYLMFVQGERMSPTAGLLAFVPCTNLLHQKNGDDLLHTTSKARQNVNGNDHHHF